MLFRSGFFFASTLLALASAAPPFTLTVEEPFKTKFLYTEKSDQISIAAAGPTTPTAPVTGKPDTATIALTLTNLATTTASVTSEEAILTESLIMGVKAITVGVTKTVKLNIVDPKGVTNPVTPKSVTALSFDIAASAGFEIRVCKDGKVVDNADNKVVFAKLVELASPKPAKADDPFVPAEPFTKKSDGTNLDDTAYKAFRVNLQFPVGSVECLEFSATGKAAHVDIKTIGVAFDAKRALATFHNIEGKNAQIGYRVKYEDKKHQFDMSDPKNVAVDPATSRATHMFENVAALGVDQLALSSATELTFDNTILAFQKKEQNINSVRSAVKGLKIATGKPVTLMWRVPAGTASAINTFTFIVAAAPGFQVAFRKDGGVYTGGRITTTSLETYITKLGDQFKGTFKMNHFAAVPAESTTHKFFVVNTSFPPTEVNGLDFSTSNATPSYVLPLTLGESKDAEAGKNNATGGAFSTLTSAAATLLVLALAAAEL